ncbi:MAG TPA: CHASE3 domain-containing protein [Casimicrobiaceae bacterium]|nr:CHASE3 domain-containing protein [Casimicrobiaceae bacterium]
MAAPRSLAPIRRLLPLRLLVPLLLGVVVSMGILVFSELGFRRLETANRLTASSLEIQGALHEVLALVVDAETSQRGYLLTGQPEYLDPYRAALPKVEQRFQRLRELISTHATAEQRERVSRFNNLIGKKLNELEATIALYEKAGRATAFELLNTGIGQRTMDQIRSEVAAISEEHAKVLSSSTALWDRDVRIARFGMQAMTIFTIVLLLVVWGLLRREMRQREEARRLLVAERERLGADVDRRTAELSELSNHLQMVREEEKTRLARDIHDELGGVLVSAKMDVAWAEERLRGTEASDAAAKLRRALESLDAGVALKRRIIEELRPSLLDNLGLGPAIEWLAHQTCDRAGIELETNVPTDAPPLPPHISIALYRIVQEALTNVLKYAKAKKVELDLVQAEDSVSLVIGDDGIGMPPEAKTHRLSHGISGMRQRVRALGGEFAIHSTIGRGTMIEVSVPLPRPDETPPVPGAVEVVVR